MANWEDIGICSVVDKESFEVAVKINGKWYSLDGIINAIVDIKLRKALGDYVSSPEQETFDKLKYSPEQLELLQIVKGK